VQVLKRDDLGWRLTALIGNLKPTQNVTGMGALKCK
jgi:hypothetical protein